MIEEILAKYSLTNASWSPITKGLINETYRVMMGKKTYILQKLNSIYSPKVMDDYLAVTKFLKKNGFLSQELILTKNKKPFLRYGDHLWRLLTYIKGKVFVTVGSSEVAYQAGYILGKFHKTMASFNYQFKTDIAPAHNSKKIFEKLEAAIPHRMDPPAANLYETIKEITSLYLPGGLRAVVTHGDPKISNIVFSTNGKEAKALIDLDGCMRNNLLVELGDAFRSWCGKGEDDVSNNFNLNYFKAALSGYLEESNGLLKSPERKLIPQAVKLITLGLASRFLRDYFEDKYFDWDRNKYSSRREHNLQRCISQVRLYKDIVKKQARITKLCNTIRYE